MTGTSIGAAFGEPGMTMSRLTGNRKRRPRAMSARRGATAIELAIVLIVFVTLILGMLDLGIAVLRSHVLAHAAREGARKAVVHGTLAVEEWGPAAFTGPADMDGHPIVGIVRPSLTGLDLSEVTVGIDWPEGDNSILKPVRVTVSTPFRPIIIFIFGNPTYTLESTSTMLIVH